jgi:hypothetical protein
VHLQTEALGRGGEAFILGPALGIGGEAQTTGHLPAGLKAGFLRQTFVEVDGVSQHLGDRGGGPQLPDKPRRMPRGAAGELAALQQKHIRPMILSQMVGRGAADDAAADDNNLGMGGQRRHSSPWRSLKRFTARFVRRRYSSAWAP